MVDQYQMRRNPGFYLANLYVYSSDNPKSANDHIVQYQFNEAIQLFIDIKEQRYICDNNVNKVYLAIQFQYAADRNIAALITKLLCLLKPKDVEMYMNHSVFAKLINNESFISRGELPIHKFNSKTLGCAI